MMADAKKYPPPQGNPETAPFWEAATQGKFLIVLEAFIGSIVVFYFGFLQHMDFVKVVIILLFSIVGIATKTGHQARTFQGLLNLIPIRKTTTSSPSELTSAVKRPFRTSAMARHLLSAIISQRG